MLCKTCVYCLTNLHDSTKVSRIQLLSVYDPTSWDFLVSSRSYQNEPIEEVEKYVYGHHKTQASYHESSQAGCILCTDNQDGRGTDLGFYSVISIRWHGEKLEIDLSHATRHVSMKMLPLPMEERRGSVLSFRSRAATTAYRFENLVLDVDGSTGGPRTLQRLRGWLEDCNQSHKQCLSMRKPGFVPTRLLEIRKSSYRLVTGASLPSGTRYISLSYCWGEPTAAPRFQLGRDNLDELRKGKNIKALPKTYRDAMHLALDLDIRYIWIDRLCIVQGDKVDWDKQSKTMWNVYANAFLTIAALGAEDDNGGLFFERSSRGVCPSIVHVRKGTKSSSTAYISGKEYTMPWQFHFYNSPLLKRAWVVQERALSPRVVYFGKTMLYWECWQRSACEINPLGLAVYGPKGDTIASMDKVPYSTTDGYFKPLLETGRMDPGQDALDGIMYQWRVTLSNYTQCHLSHATDRLVAISGLAEQYRKVFQMLKPESEGQVPYLEGHWQHTLPRSLLWSTSYGSRKDAVVTASSWSWASVDHTHPNTELFESPGFAWYTYCSYIGYKSALIDHAMNGGVREHIVLQLRGTLTELRIEQKEGVFGSRQITRLTMSVVGTTMKRSLDGSNFDEAHVWYDDDIFMSLRDVFGLPISMVESEHSYKLEFLLLQKHGMAYRRIGIARLWFRNHQQVGPWLKQFETQSILLE